MESGVERWVETLEEGLGAGEDVLIICSTDVQVSPIS